MSSRAQAVRHGDGWFDRLVYFIAIAEPLMTAPQAWKIWSERSAAGVSIVSWGFYLVSAVILLIYSLRSKRRPLIIMYVLWILMEAIIVAGVAKYG